METTAYEYLIGRLHELAGAAAMGAAYKGWSSGFRIKEIDNAWNDRADVMRKTDHRRVTIADLQSLADDQRYALRVGSWDGTLRLIPLWMWNYLADGEVLTSINGGTKIKGTDDIDLDVRFGCVACGFKAPVPTDLEIAR